MSHEKITILLVFSLLVFCKSEKFKIPIDLSSFKLNIDFQSLFEFSVNNVEIFNDIENLIPEKILNLTNEYAPLPFNLQLLTDKLVWLRDMVRENRPEGACFRDILYTLRSAAALEQWAIEMLDSMPIIPSSLLQGNGRWTTSYSECLGAVETSVPPSLLKMGIKPVRGKYCWLVFLFRGFNQTAPFMPSVCVPDTCTESDLRQGLTSVTDIVPSLLPHYKVADVACMPLPSVTNPKILTGFIICGVFLIVIIIGTVYEVFILQNTTSSSIFKNLSSSENEIYETKRKYEYKDHYQYEVQRKTLNEFIPHSEKRIIKEPNTSVGRILTAFSLLRNGRKLFSHDGDLGKIKVLDGIRVLSMFWILMGHTGIGLLFLGANLLIIKEFEDTYTIAITQQAFLAVDSFLFLGGLLVAITVLKMRSKRKKISWLHFYIVRYFRLTPTNFFVIIIFYICLKSWFRYGPLSYSYIPFEESCETTWWRDILYINNFQNQSDSCPMTNWYLAVDMQLYLISPLFLILICKSKKWAFIIGGLSILGSSLLSALLSYYNGFVAKFDKDQLMADPEHPFDQVEATFNLVYSKPYCRMSCYLLGMGCGWLLHKTQFKFEMSQGTVFIGWFLSLSAILLTVFISTIIDLTVGNSAIFLLLSRIFWGLSLAWIVIACSTGYGGIINDFLSWQFWTPLSRATFSTYLIQATVIFSMIDTFERVQFLTLYSLYIFTTTSIVFSYLAGMIIYLTIESPFENLLKLVLVSKLKH